MAHTILFHGNCIDGWFSAYIAHSAIKSGPIQMFPIAPGQMNTWPSMNKLVGTHIIMLDVSVPEKNRAYWMAHGALSINCIDHHSSSIEHWPKDACPINVNTCAALQTFHHFYPDRPIPFWLVIIDRIDRWENVSREDRYFREVLNIIAHKPVQKEMEEAIALTNQFIADMDDSSKILATLTQGKEILAKKDAELIESLSVGTIHTLTQDYLNGWKLPANWLNANVFIIDNTNIVFDSTEAAHLIFINNPHVSVFINYRKKTFYTKGPNPIIKTMYVYSARSRGFNLTEGTIFNGHPTAAGASIEKEKGVFLPFILTP